MKQFLIFCILSMSICQQSWSRSPAVEDYVEIPPKHDYFPLEEEVAGMVNFQKELEQKVRQQERTRHLGFRFSYLFFLMALISLPFSIWWGILRQMDRKEMQKKINNLKVLAEYERGANNYQVKQQLKSQDQNTKVASDDEDLPKAS